ncbi:MAG: TonB-dependent receptor [Gemmatimonadaceae bacterium]|nr:TonB-dependent receptor [Gemmatimonadaceae bacterium]
MSRTLAAVLALAMAAGTHSLNAQPSAPQGAGPQQPPAAIGEVRGTVTEGESSSPLSGASVAVRSKAGSALVAGAFVKPDGSFRVQGLGPGTYVVRVTSMGFGPKTTEEFTISPASAQVNVGSIKMSRVAVALQGVEVTAERAAVTIEPDRNSYRAKDVAATATNASDVLDAVPSVQVDGEGKVSLRGNENVAIQINGRPAPIRGPQLAAYLKQIPASIVERVEVVPTPSARYDPEGMAGIINLVLKQNADLGMSGGVTVGSATAEGRYNGSGNVANQSGPWTLFSSYGFNSDDREIVGINNRERYDALRIPLLVTEQDILGQNGNVGHNFNSTVDYKLTDRDVLTNVLSLNLRNSTDNSVSAYTELNGSGSLLDRYDRIRDTDAKAFVLDYTLALKRTIEPRKHEIASEIRFNRAKDDDNTNLWRQSLASPSSRVESEDNDTDALTRQVIGQLDYTRTLALRTKLETGYKGTGRWLDRDYVVRKDALGDGNWLASNLSNDFSFDEQVQAAYGVLSHGIGKLELQGGLRAEYASRDFTLKKSSESFPFSYASVFPSAVANYKFSEATQAKVAYSRRIRRPGTQELNPFPVFFDVQNLFLGNPKLNPEYTDAIELGLTRSGQLGTLQLSPFYRRTTDIIRVNINTADTYDGREVTSVSFQNLATSNSWGTDLNGQLRLGKKFSAFSSFNVFKMVTDGGSESTLSSNAVTWSTRFNATAQVTPALTFQGSYFYRAPTKIERGEFASTQMANLSLRQKIMDDKATVSLRVVDPFNTMGMKIKTGDDNIMQFTERKFGVRAAYLTFQYNFGQAPRIRQPRPEDTQAPSTGFPAGD